MQAGRDARDGNEESALRAAFEDAPFEFWIRDADGRCVVQNAAARAWGDQRGRRAEESSVPGEIRAMWAENNRRAYAGEHVQREFECVRDSETRHFQAVVVPLRMGGQVRGVLGFNIDVTQRKRAEEALRESERRLRSALRIGRMGYLDWDLVTNEIRWSPETYRLFGYEPDSGFCPTIESTVGMVPVEERAFVQAKLDAVVRGTAPYDLIHRMVRPDGKTIHVHAQGEVARDENGRALRMLGTVVDISERREAEEALRRSEARLKQSLRAAAAGTWEWDIRTGEARWSAENYDLYGVDPSRQRLTYADWRDRVHPEDLVAIDEAMKDAFSSRTPEYRAEFRVRVRGEERWLLAMGQIARAPDGTPLRMAGISLDITKRKRAEEELRQIDRHRNDFLGVLSHELRNPLTPIRNSLYVLGQTVPAGEPARRAVEVIERQVNHLARLVDDLLDITRISSGKIRLQRAHVDLVELARRTVDDHESLFAARRLAVELPETALWVYGDETRLAQVLGNLLSNAAKFTPDNGRITISLTSADGRATLKVADDGLGMDAETLSRLFSPFAQADRSLDRSRGGLGLGLALVKALVDLHGGDVGAHSDGPGRGACLTVRLPLEAPVGRATSAAPSPIEIAPLPRKVLIIEDNRDAADSMAETLALWGHQVVVTVDGASGLQAARDFEPDIILCDIGLPGALDGYAVARALQEDTRLAQAYRVALTGYAQPKDLARAVEAGFDTHLAKPPELQVLRRLLAGGCARPPR